MLACIFCTSGTLLTEVLICCLCLYTSLFYSLLIISPSSSLYPPDADTGEEESDAITDRAEPVAKIDRDVHTGQVLQRIWPVYNGQASSERDRTLQEPTDDAIVPTRPRAACYG